MATAIVVPAILTEDVEELKASMAKYAAFAKRIQIDISDGTMTESRTVDESAVPVPVGTTIDMHMMVADPEAHIDKVIAVKPHLVIFHAEVEGDLLPVFEKLKQSGIKVGVAFLKQTYPGNYKAYVDAADHALIFAGTLGEQGSTADLMQVEKARLIRTMRKDIEIGWDGGATLANIRTIFQGGVPVINVGGELANAIDPKDEYDKLVTEAEKLGVM